MKNNIILKFLVAIVLFLCLTLPHLEQGDFRRDTVRYAAIGLNMWETGDLLKPRYSQGRPYFNKPPLVLLIHGLSLKLFGANLIAARIPSIIAACLVILFTMLIARKLGGNKYDLISGLTLALTYGFFRRVREISLDMWLLVFILGAVYFGIAALSNKKIFNFILVGLFIGLGLLCKPLLSFLSLVILGLFYFTLGRYKLFFYLLIIAGLISILVGLPWHIYMWINFQDDFLNVYLGQQVLDRAKGTLIESQLKSNWFYIKLLCLNYWPWMITLISGFYFYFKNFFAKQKKTIPKYVDNPSLLITLGFIFFAIFIISLSLFPDKKVNYLLPVYPALSWISTFGLISMFPTIFKYIYNSRIILKTCFVIILISGIVSFLPIKFHESSDTNWSEIQKWINKNNVTKNDLAVVNLSSNDICYFYLKIGYWPIIVEDDIHGLYGEKNSKIDIVKYIILSSKKVKNLYKLERNFEFKTNAPYLLKNKQFSIYLASKFF